MAYKYPSTYGSLPPAAITDANGKPLMRWRVAILPFIEEDAFYQQIKLQLVEAPMQFWKMTEPSDSSDYEHSYVNGELEHPFGLPGVDCDVCRQTWGGLAGYPSECPEPLRKRKHLRDGWPVKLREHLAMQQKSAMKSLAEASRSPYCARVISFSRATSTFRPDLGRTFCGVRSAVSWCRTGCGACLSHCLSHRSHSVL